MNFMDKYMFVAFKEALKAAKKDEVPVGAVIVKDGKVIAKALLSGPKQDRFPVHGGGNFPERTVGSRIPEMKFVNSGRLIGNVPGDRTPVRTHVYGLIIKGRNVIGQSVVSGKNRFLCRVYIVRRPNDQFLQVRTCGGGGIELDLVLPFRQGHT